MIVRGLADGSREAVRILQSEAVGPLELSIRFHMFPIEQDVLGFYRFVTTLEQSGERLAILNIYSAAFDRPSSNNDSVAHFLGRVVPSHPSLNCFRLEGCTLLPDHVELFASSLVSVSQGSRGESLHTLDFYNTPLNHQGVVAMTSLLRANVQIESLQLRCCGIDSAGCRVLFESMDSSTHLTELNLKQNRISDMNFTAVKVLAKSNLRSLFLNDNPMTDESKRILTEGLRANETLEGLYISHSDPGSRITFDLFEDLLRRFNYKISWVFVFNPGRLMVHNGNADRISELLQFNRHVRSIHTHLLNSNYNLPLQPLWPSALERIGSKASLLYRFVRRGNLDELADLLRLGQTYRCNDINSTTSHRENLSEGNGGGIALEEEDLLHPIRMDRRRVNSEGKTMHGE